MSNIVKDIQLEKNFNNLNNIIRTEEENLQHAIEMSLNDY